VGDDPLTQPVPENEIADEVRVGLERHGLQVANESFLGRGGIVANLPGGDVLLVEIKTSSPRVRFSQLAQLADWMQLATSIDQIGNAHVVLVTDGEVVPSVAEFAEQVGVSIVPITEGLDIGESILEAVSEHR
jgi:hypothetical protein